MALEFKLPDIGEGLTEGEITKWLVKEGQQVAADQPMMEVLTDKATVEITAPKAGVIEKILVPDGTKVPVGTVLVVIGDGSGAGSKSAQQAGQAPVAKPAPAAGHAPAAKPAAPPAAHAKPAAAPGASGSPVARPAPAPAPAEEPEPVAAAAIDEDRVVLAAPATRARARELGIDLRSVPA